VGILAHIFTRALNCVFDARRWHTLLWLLWLASGAVATEAHSCKTILWDADHLRNVRSESIELSSNMKIALRQLRANADDALERGPYSVMDKTVVPPSGDKHDYLSYSRYWWPDPDSSDGLPYIRRDGQTNRESVALGDRIGVGSMCDDVETLSLAFYFFEDEEYAKHAAFLLHTWFLDPQTRMNPHLRFAQAVPGLTEGKRSGIIDTRHFIRVLDAVALLEESKEWPPSVHRALKDWFTEYLHWLRSSPLGVAESQSENNHGTWYDAQTARIALFVGQHQVAEDIVRRSRTERLEKQISADGRQPEELARTNSLHYSLFNLSALCALARVGDAVEVSLWEYPSSEDPALRRALDYLLPYLKHEKHWPHEQIAPFSISPEEIYVLQLASLQYSDSKYVDIPAKIARVERESNYVPLLLPSLSQRVTAR
jgi:Alginate lyase